MDAPSDRLNGWKEIAAFLGKSVRSAQRWESELGLPVERLVGPDGGQIVQASRRDIEDWRHKRVHHGLDTSTSAEPQDAAVGVEGGDAFGPHLESLPPSAVKVSPRRELPWLEAGALLAVGAATGFALSLATMPLVRIPARFAVHGTVVQALTDEGLPVWTHELGRIATRPAMASPIGGRLGDLDGDGEMEAAVPVAYTMPWTNTPQTSDEVLIFTRRGRLRHVVRPGIVIVNRGQHRSGPWQFSASAFADGGTGRLWTAYSGATGVPSFILETDGGGASRVRFVVDGTVNALTRWTVDGQERLAVGGHDVAGTRAFVAVLSLDGAGARWPAGSGGPSCEGCGSRTPETLVQLPPTELMPLLLRPHSYVYRTRPLLKRLVVETEAGVRTATMFWLDPQLRVVGHMWMPAYEAMHRQLETEGRINHSWHDCPERAGPLQIRRWQPSSGWTEEAVTAGVRLSDPVAAP